jgi:hypothetical protein
LNKLNQSINEEMEELISISNHHVINLLEHIKLSQNFQEEIKNYVNKTDRLTKGLYNCIKND